MRGGGAVAASRRRTAATSPTTTAAPLQVWYDASKISGLSDGATISTISDSSGNNITSTTTTGSVTYSATGLNSKPAYYFNGSSYTDSVNFSAQLTGVITVFVVYQITQATGTAQCVFSAAANPNKLEFGRTGGSNQWTIGRNGGGQGGTTDTLSHYAQIIYGVGGNSSLYINNSAITLSNTNVGSAAVQKVRLGAYADNTSPVKGYISELLTYNGSLTASETSDVQTYLVNKWGF